MAAGFFGQRFEDSGIFNLEHGPDEPALLGIKPNPALYAFIRIEVKPDGGLTAIVDELPLAHPLVTNEVTLWGVPADSNPANVARDWPRVPFMTAPTECGDARHHDDPRLLVRGQGGHGDRQTRRPGRQLRPRAVRADDDGDAHRREAAARLPGSTFASTCRRTTSRTASRRRTSRVRIVLPEGMKVSPSSANGLASCAPAPVRLQNRQRGDVSRRLEDRQRRDQVAAARGAAHRGSVFLAKQNDNPFGSLLALYIVAEGSGVQIKLAGRVDPDPVTGRLTTTFDDNPQLPFEQFDLSFKSGPRAPLTQPADLRRATSRKRRSPRGTAERSRATTPMTVDQDCQPLGFAPSFQAGTANPVGGASSTFSLTFGRGDHDQELRDVTVDLPPGLTGKIARRRPLRGRGRPPPAPAARARGSARSRRPPDRARRRSSCRAARTSPVRTRVRRWGWRSSCRRSPGRSTSARSSCGRRSSSIAATPRCAIVSDPLPRILQGIPLQIRSVSVAVDKPGFMLNPTSCSRSGSTVASAPAGRRRGRRQPLPGRQAAHGSR